MTRAAVRNAQRAAAVRLSPRNAPGAAAPEAQCGVGAAEDESRAPRVCKQRARKLPRCIAVAAARTSLACVAGAGAAAIAGTFLGEEARSSLALASEERQPNARRLERAWRLGAALLPAERVRACARATEHAQAGRQVLD